MTANRFGTFKDRLAQRMGWPTAMLSDSWFPLKRIEFSFDVTGEVCMRFTIDGKWSYFKDDPSLFPSEELQATLHLLCGPMSELRENYTSNLIRVNRRSRNGNVIGTPIDPDKWSNPEG